MNKAIGLTIGIFVLTALVVAAMPDTRDEIHWQWSSYKDTAVSFESYIKAWPSGRHASEAIGRYDNHCWADAKSANSIEGFERYIGLHGNGKHVRDAKNSIDILDWQKATNTNTVEGFERYIGHHGGSRHVSDARGRIESLRWEDVKVANTIIAFRNYSTMYPEGVHLREAQRLEASLRIDDAPFEEALKTGTEASLKQFLNEFPGHQKENDAKQSLKDITSGRDIVDLLSEKKIQIETKGSGIKSIGIRMRKLIPYPVTVRVPVGSFFVSSRQSAQNMVATAESKVRLTTDDWQQVSVPAACANRPRDIPGIKDTFTVKRSPKQQELARLMPVLDKAGVSYATRQAAVWIVTDNADYDDLGILVSGQAGLSMFHRTRQINESEAAQAMKICSDAGIRIKRKAIWKDHEIVYWGLNPEDISRAWLENQNRSLSKQVKQIQDVINVKLKSANKNLLKQLKNKRLSIHVSAASGKRGTYRARLVASFLRDHGHDVSIGSLYSSGSPGVAVYYHEPCKAEATAISGLMEVLFNTAIICRNMQSKGIAANNNIVIWIR